jgi:hypothetical protein
MYTKFCHFECILYAVCYVSNYYLHVTYGRYHKFHFVQTSGNRKGYMGEGGMN